MSRTTRKEKKMRKNKETVKISVQHKHKQKKYVLPYVKKSDNFTPEQLKPIVRKTIVFGTFVSISIMTTIAFITFVVLSVGMDMILTNNRPMVTFISFVLWLSVVIFFLLSYWKLGEIYRLVRKYRKQAAVESAVHSAEETEQAEHL